MLILVFAFLAASFPARNSDLWLHLASGRLIAEGDFTFGVDPFAYTTAGQYWVNSSWLTDLALFQALQVGNGRWLVLLKAVWLAGLAGVLLRSCRGPGPNWLRTAGMLLAILAISPGMELRSTIISFTFLSLTFLMLRQGGRAIWGIPVLVALWVNLDSWFFLGPVMVVVFLIGGIREGHFGSLSLLLVLTLLASLASPHHIHSWQAWPPECDLWLRQGMLPQDSRFQGLFTPGWQLPALIQANPDNLSLWASGLLFVFGAMGLLLNPARLFSSSGFLWLVFAGLAAFNIRLVPFFAVVGTPIAVRWWGSILSREALPLSGPALVTLASLLLMGLCVPGWLQGMDRRDRPLGWSLERNPSLEQAARAVVTHRHGRADANSGRLFPTHPDAAHYLSWFAPGEKTFADSRWPLFENVLPDYEKLCQGLGIPGGANGLTCTPEEWQSLLEKWQIDGILLWDPEPRRLQAALQTIRSIHASWRIRELTGHAFLLERDPGSTPEWNPVDRSPATEAMKPLKVLPSRGLWDDWSKPRPGPVLESENAVGILRVFEANRQADLGEKRNLAGSLLAASLLSGDSGSLQALALLTLDAVLGHSSAIGNRSPTMPAAALGWSHRALATNPADSTGWFALGRALYLLAQETPEASPRCDLPPLQFLRQVQISTALEQALNLDHRLMAAHEMLAQRYLRRNYLDLALRHWQHAQSRQSPVREDSPSPWLAIERQVYANENRFWIRTAGLSGDPLARARIALQLGLADKARDALLQSRVDLYGVEGLRLLTELLLLTGRIDDASTILDRDELRSQGDRLGMVEISSSRNWSYRLPAYDWFDFCRKAALADTQEAERILRRVRMRLESAEGEAFQTMRGQLAWKLGSELAFASSPSTLFARWFQQAERNRLSGLLEQTQFVQIEATDLQLIGELLRRQWGLSKNPDRAMDEIVGKYLGLERMVRMLPGLELARRYRDLDRAP